jgi:tetratricopeptide (TPR) repeat protein
MLREEEAIREILQARELDPFSPNIAADTVLVFVMLRHYGEAIEYGLQAIEAHPNFSIGYKWLGTAYRNIEQLDEATAQLSRAVELEPNPPNVALLAEIYALSGETSKAHEKLEQLDQLQEQGLYYCPYERALVYISLNDKDEAFELLEQAYSERANCMPWLRADQYMDPLRDDPRFHDLIRRMNLTEP